MIKMDVQTDTNVFYGGNRNGNILKGPPKERWKDAVPVDTREILGVREWKSLATNRERWKVIIEEAKARL